MVQSEWNINSRLRAGTNSQNVRGLVHVLCKVTVRLGRATMGSRSRRPLQTLNLKPYYPLNPNLLP